jgi:hypothetical protein
MRLTSRRKRSAIVVILFHDFAIDDAIFLASYVIDKRAHFSSVVSNTWRSSAAVTPRSPTISCLTGGFESPGVTNRQPGQPTLRERIPRLARFQAPRLLRVSFPLAFMHGFHWRVSFLAEA